MARLPHPVKNSFPYFSNFCPMEKCHNFFDIHTDNFRKLIRYGYNLFLAIVGKKIRRPTLCAYRQSVLWKFFPLQEFSLKFPLLPTQNISHALSLITPLTTQRRNQALCNVSTRVLSCPNVLNRRWSTFISILKCTVFPTPAIRNNN